MNDKQMSIMVLILALSALFIGFVLGKTMYQPDESIIHVPDLETVYYPPLSDTLPLVESASFSMEESQMNYRTYTVNVYGDKSTPFKTLKEAVCNMEVVDALEKAIQN